MGFLVLTLHKDDAIIIRHAGETLLIKIAADRHNQRRLAFEGPKSFRVDREGAKDHEPPESRR